MAKRSMLLAIVVGGLLGGALDLAFALTFAGANGVGPARVFQTIASGILGNAAFSGGDAVLALGVACHFGISVIWAALFAAVAWQAPKVVRRPVLAGIVFGVVVFFCMRLVVLPISAYPRPVTFKPLSTMLDLLSHMLLFGVPIAWAISRVIQARKANFS